MKSSIDILSSLYELVNVNAVTNLLSGAIYINGIPGSDQKDNIDLNSLNNPNEYLQTGFLNLNIYAMETKAGRPDLEKFKTITDIIIPLLKDTHNNGVYFQIDDDKGIFKDNDRDQMYFYNIRLTFQTI